MHILFFSDHFYPEPSAPAAHIFERAKLWVSWGHQVTVMASAPNFPEGRIYPGYANSWRSIEEMEGVRVVRVKTFIARNEGFLFRILDYCSYMTSAFFFSLFEQKPDVVISSSPHLFVAVAGLACGMIRRVPHVFEIRDLWPASLLSTDVMKPGRLYHLLERFELFLYRHSTLILSFTHAFSHNLTARGVPVEKIRVVINGANLELFSPRPKDKEIERQYGLSERFVVGYLGTIGLAHGLDSAIRAAKMLENYPISFFFVGVGAAKQKLQQVTRTLDVRNMVFAPRQLKEDMPRFWSVCDASLIHLKNSMVFTTVIPSKIFESMAMGIPIVYAVPPGEGSAIVTRHEAGIVVPPEDPQALACAVRALAADTERCSMLGANSLVAAPYYSRERQARDTLAVLEETAGSLV